MGARGSYLCCWCGPGCAAGRAGCPPAWSGPSAAASASASSSCAAPGRRGPAGPARWRTPESPWRPGAAPSPARSPSRSLPGPRGALQWPVTAASWLSPAPRDPPALPLHPQGPNAHSGISPLHLGAALAHHPTPAPDPRQDVTLPRGVCKSRSCCFLSITPLGGRKHSLICNPIALSASDTRSGKTTSRARHRASPEPRSDVGWEPPTPKLPLKTHQVELAQGSLGDAAFPQQFLSPRHGGHKSLQPLAWPGVPRALKRERGERDPSLPLPPRASHWDVPCRGALGAAPALPCQLDQGHHGRHRCHKATAGDTQRGRELGVAGQRWDGWPGRSGSGANKQHSKVQPVPEAMAALIAPREPVPPPLPCPINH